MEDNMNLSHKNYSILIVDDNRISRRITSGVLKSLGVNVFEAENGQEAIDFLKEFRVTAVFMNVSLPGMSGYESTQGIRNLSINNDVPIIAITSEQLVEMSEEMIHIGFTNVLCKPYQIDAIVKLFELFNKDAIPVFDYKQYIKTYKDISLQKDIVQTFIDEEESDTNRINDSFSSRDGEKIYSAVHYMKGSFSYLKASKILIVTQTILDHIREGNLTLALPHEETFKTQYKELVEELKKYNF